MSLPGLSHLARRAQGPLPGSVDHGERRPPLGHRGPQPGGVGAAPELGQAEVSAKLQLLSTSLCLFLFLFVRFRGDVSVRRNSQLESCVLESDGDTEDEEDSDGKLTRSGLHTFQARRLRLADLHTASSFGPRRPRGRWRRRGGGQRPRLVVALRSPVSSEDARAERRACVCVCVMERQVCTFFSV